MTIDPYQPPPGIIKTVAQADYNHGGAELPGREIVIVARRWDATTFLTHTTAGGQQTSDTSADSGTSGSPFYFHFSKLDQRRNSFTRQTVSPKIGRKAGHALARAARIRA